jgi:BlaI family transcriptional regulator, penicillinase repressor
VARTKRVLLTNLELEVMHVVWDDPSGALTVREVADRMNDGRKKGLAYNTVQTMLTILKDKGVVGSEIGAGRAHRFFAKATREQVTTSMVGDLVDRLFQGDVQPLLLELVGNEKLTRTELEELKRRIETQLTVDEEDV